MFRNLERLTLVHEIGIEGHPDVFHFRPKRDEDESSEKKNSSSSSNTSKNSRS